MMKRHRSAQYRSSQGMAARIAVADARYPASWSRLAQRGCRSSRGWRCARACWGPCRRVTSARGCVGADPRRDRNSHGTAGDVTPPSLSALDAAVEAGIRLDRDRRDGLRALAFARLPGERVGCCVRGRLLAAVPHVGRDALRVAMVHAAGARPGPSDRLPQGPGRARAAPPRQVPAGRHLAHGRPRRGSSGLGHQRPALVDFVLLENLVAAGFALGVRRRAAVPRLARRAGTASLPALRARGLLGLALVPWGIRLVTRSGRIFPAARYLRLLALTAASGRWPRRPSVALRAGFGGPACTASLPAIYGTYLFSWGAGFVAFFAPQGIGVFEFVSGKLLEGQLDLGHAVALMASFRVIVLAGDLFAWAVVLVRFRRLSVR